MGSVLPALDEGTNVTVDAWLTPPATPGSEPAPAIIIVHGCGGPGSSERDWATELSDEGFVTALLDSFGRRGVGEVCSGGETLNVADLIIDVYRTADLLRDRPDVDGDRIAVLGFSFGGRTALWSALTRFQERYDGAPLQAYGAFYPSTCFIRLEAETEVAGGPIAIFHGTADDWTPIEPCQDYVDRLRSDGVDAAMFAYQDAHHGFDGRWLAWGGLHLSPGVPSPRGCTFVESDGMILDPDTGGVAGVSSPCVELGVHYAYDEDSRKHASRDLIGFLRATFAS